MSKMHKPADNKLDPLLSEDVRGAEDTKVEFLTPVDKGWAWIIAFSAFMNLFITVGYNRSLSVLFVDIGEAFQESNKVVSLMFTLHAVSGSIVSIFTANVLMNKFNVRTITVFSAAINGVASALVSFAPNIVIFLLLFLIKGLSFGGLLICPMSLIGFYFKKRRALASALANAGFCVAYIVFPPITELLRVNYGYKGTLLIISGVELNLVAINMLLRPVESYNRVIKKKSSGSEKWSPIYKGAMDNCEEKITLTRLKKDKLKQHNSHSFSCNETKIEENGDFQIVENIEKIDLNDTSSSIKFDFYVYDCHYEKETRDTNDSLLLNEKLSSAPARDRTTGDMSTDYTSQLSIVSNGEVPCVIDTQIVKETVKEEKRLNCPFQNTFDFTLFKSWLFRLLILFTGLGVFTNYLSIYMPIIAYTSGIDKTDAAILMAVSGLMDLLTRVITGFMGDFKFVSKTKMVAFSTFVISIVCQCSRLFNTYPLFVLFAILTGIFGGFRQNFSNAILLDHFGAENLAKANGLIVTIATLMLSINHPVLGAMLDATGSFVIPLHYVGAMVFLATIVLLLEPLAKKLDDRNRVKEEQQMNKNLQNA